MEKTKIESKKISVFYGEKKALSGISLNIPEKKVTSDWPQWLWEINVFKMFK